jgi:hypothetical protein
MPMASSMQIPGKNISNGTEKNELVKMDGTKCKWYLEKFVFL